MNKLGTVLCTILLTSTAAVAEEKRDLDSHEHGVAQLNVAVEGKTVVMEFEAPGADIVGFEHPASSAEDKGKISAAISALEDLNKLVSFPAGANCAITEIKAELHSESEHSEEEGHDEHHAEAEQSEDEGHTEFHAEYALNCENIQKIDEMTFPYFDTFKNAEEIEVQIVTESGANKFEVMRTQPQIDLSGMI